MSAGSSGKLAIDLVAADALVATYRSTSETIDNIRRQLIAPWATANAQLGYHYASVPDALRAIVDNTDAGARDLQWRLDYIRARYSHEGGHRLQVVELPERLPELQRLSTSDLVARLTSATDPQAIRDALDELLARSAGHTGVAVEVVQRLSADDIDRLFTQPDLTADLDELIVPLSLLVSYACNVHPLEVAHLFKGDDPIDMLRIVALLEAGDYPGAMVAELLTGAAELMAQPSFAWQYSLLPVSLAPYDQAARSWLMSFENPMVAIMAEVTDPAEAFELLQTPGLIELIVNVPTEVASGQSVDEALAAANQAVGDLIDLATLHLAELHDRAAFGEAGGPADPADIAAFNDGLAASYDMLLALRDHAPGGAIHGDPVRDAAARLTAWHFGELASGGWPLGESAGVFARWLAASDDAVAALVLGASAFIASILPTLVARFDTDPAAGEVAAAVSLDQVKTVLAFLTIGLSQIPTTPEAISQWRVLADLVWSSILAITPAGVLAGTAKHLKVLRLLLRRMANDAYTFLADSGGPVKPVEVSSIADVLAELFFTIDGFGGSNNIEDVRPLQLALFAALLGYHPEATQDIPELADFVVDGHLVPPPKDASNYPQFLEVFAKVTTTDSDLARHYIVLWELIVEWSSKGVAEAEVHGP